MTGTESAAVHPSRAGFAGPLRMTGKGLMTPSQSHVPIAVVGAGPTGLTLANLLGVYGVPCAVIERNASTVSEPRAVSIDDESLRTMQAIGLDATVIAETVTGYGAHYFSSRGRCFAKVQPSEEPFG